MTEYYMIHIFWLYKTLKYDLNSDPNLEKSQVRNPIRMILNEPRLRNSYCWNLCRGSDKK